MTITNSENAAERKDWDNLIIDYAGSGCVGCFGEAIRLHASRDGCTATVPQRTFDRLVAEGRIDADGKPLDVKP